MTQQLHQIGSQQWNTTTKLYKNKNMTNFHHRTKDCCYCISSGSRLSFVWFVRILPIVFLLTTMMVRPIRMMEDTTDDSTTMNEQRQQHDVYEQQEEEDEQQQPFPYLYGTRENPFASYPILDHYYNLSDPRLVDEPDFLYPSRMHTQKNHHHHPTTTTDLPHTNWYRIVVFYIHWCNTCRNYVPHYRQLGTKLSSILEQSNIHSKQQQQQQQQHHDPIKLTFHAISCSPNMKLCQNQKVSRYPRLRLYRPQDRIGMEVPYNRLNPHTILRKMGIPLFVQQQQEQQQGRNDDDNDNEEMDIDTAPVTSMIDENQNETDHLAVLPKWQRMVLYTLGIFDPNNNNTKSQTPPVTTTRTLLVPDDYYTKRGRRHDDSSSSFFSKVGTTKTTTTTTTIPNSNGLMNDIHVTLDYTFRTSIYTSSNCIIHTNTKKDSDDEKDENETMVLTSRTKKVLKDWLFLLSKILPPSWTNLHALIQDMNQNYQYIISSSSYLYAVLDEYAPPPTIGRRGVASYSFTCSESMSSSPYTCGLWSFFHMVTIGVCEYNAYYTTTTTTTSHQDAKETNTADATTTATSTVQQQQDQDQIPTEYVAHMIRQFISHFMMCDTCRKHFLQQYDNCAHKRCYVLHESIVPDPIRIITSVIQTTNVTTTDHNNDDHTNHIDQEEQQQQQVHQQLQQEQELLHETMIQKFRYERDQTLILWLFETHNSVNVRLFIESTIRNKNQNHDHQPYTIQDIYNRLYPPRFYCPDCWNYYNVTTTTNDNNNNKSTTNETTQYSDHLSTVEDNNNDILNHPEQLIYQYNPDQIVRYLQYEYYGSNDLYSTNDVHANHHDDEEVWNKITDDNDDHNFHDDVNGSHSYGVDDHNNDIIDSYLNKHPSTDNNHNDKITTTTTTATSESFLVYVIGLSSVYAIVTTTIVSIYWGSSKK